MNIYIIGCWLSRINIRIRMRGCVRAPRVLRVGCMWAAWAAWATQVTQGLR